MPSSPFLCLSYLPTLSTNSTMTISTLVFVYVFYLFKGTYICSSMMQIGSTTGLSCLPLKRTLSS